MYIYKKRVQEHFHQTANNSFLGMKSSQGILFFLSAFHTLSKYLNKTILVL